MRRYVFFACIVLPISCLAAVVAVAVWYAW
jgi:hypothetical protein